MMKVDAPFGPRKKDYANVLVNKGIGGSQGSRPNSSRAMEPRDWSMESEI